MTRVQLLVTVQLEKRAGLFASTDELAGELIAAIESADPGDVSGVGSQGDSEYEVTSWDVAQA